MQPLDWSLLPRAMLGVVALLAGNGYIVGINQIYDVDIDAVNKPFLPIAAGRGCPCQCVANAEKFCQPNHCAANNAGELSPGLAWVLCIGLAVAGLTITATNFGRPITLLYAFGLFLGTIYRCCYRIISIYIIDLPTCK